MDASTAARVARRLASRARVAVTLAALTGFGAAHTRVDASQATPALRLKIAADDVEIIAADGIVAGRYHYTDPFKPYVHPLATPKGYCVSLAMPHDHKHHKGLMYALRLPELNFWEEVARQPGEAVGRVRHVAFSDVREAGDEVGFTETLSWESAAGGEAVFAETRRISCRREAGAFRWEWKTNLTPRRAVKLVQSPASFKRTDGTRINYHGLGLRLRREFGGSTLNNALQLDDGPVQWNKGSRHFDFNSAMGATPAHATFIGSIDGIWPVPQAAVTLAQQQHYGLFVMDTPFAFLAFGPSNLAERSLAAGETLVESYTIVVADQ